MTHSDALAVDSVGASGRQDDKPFCGKLNLFRGFN